MPNGDDGTIKEWVARYTERLARTDRLISTITMARDALLHVGEQLKAGEEVDITALAWAEDYIDRLWSASERGEPRTLEALALMNALDRAPGPDRVVDYLRAWGYPRLGERLAKRCAEVGRAWTWWHHKTPGAPESGTKRVSKWQAVAALTDGLAASLEQLWKKNKPRSDKGER